MSSTNIRPRWWQLYLTFPLLIVLFVVDSRLKLSTRGHQALQIGIVVLVYGLIHIWLKANARALSYMDQQQMQGTFKVIRIPFDQATSEKKLFHFPTSEVKGVLSDTFEMDVIDAEAFPVEEVPQKLDEE